MSALSKYIDDGEFRCKCCGELPPGLVKMADGEYPACFQRLFNTFDAVREAWGKPIIITSAYRCVKHNAAVGGAPLSVHLFGLAVDLAITGDEVEPFVRLVREIDPDIRIGWMKYAGTLVHLDVGYSIWPSPSDDFEEGVEW